MRSAGIRDACGNRRRRSCRECRPCCLCQFLEYLTYLVIIHGSWLPVYDDDLGQVCDEDGVQWAPAGFRKGRLRPTAADWAVAAGRRTV